jgi:hypothetical protein
VQADLWVIERAIKRLQTRFPNAVLSKMALKSFTLAFERRAWLLMWGLKLNTYSLLITAAIASVQAILWILSDSAMTKWCKRNVFTSSREERYDEVEEQMDDFREALLEAR